MVGSSQRRGTNDRPRDQFPNLESKSRFKSKFRNQEHAEDLESGFFMRGPRRCFVAEALIPVARLPVPGPALRYDLHPHLIPVAASRLLAQYPRQELNAGDG